MRKSAVALGLLILAAGAGVLFLPRAPIAPARELPVDRRPADLRVAERPSRPAISPAPGRGLEVTVTDLNTKRPVAGALVEVHLSKAEPPPLVTALTTDETGRAKLSGLPPGHYLLTVTRAGYVRARSSFVPDDTDQWEVELEPHAPFTGRVLLPNGRAAEGATVSADVDASEDQVIATTASDGTFTLPFPRPELCARKGELVASGSPEEAKAKGLVLAQRTPAVGQVLSLQGDRPLGGVRVRAVWGALEAVTLTDREGNFSFAGLCEKYPDLTFERADFMPQVRGFERGKKSVIRVPAPGRLRGTVVDDDGRPVAAAQVVVEDERNIDQQTVADAQGGFTFARVREKLIVRANEGERWGNIEVTVAPGQEREVSFSIGADRMKVPVEVVQDGKVSKEDFEIEAHRIDGVPFKESIHWNAEHRSGDVIHPSGLALPAGAFKVTAENEWGVGELEVRVLRAEVQPALRIQIRPKPPPRISGGPFAFRCSAREGRRSLARLCIAPGIRPTLLELTRRGAWSVA